MTLLFVFFKQKTAYEMRISDWSSDVCSSDLALLAQASGLDGVVCSPHEIASLRRVCGPEFLLVVPGIRPSWAAAGDQKRIMTPQQAVAAGADYLEIGRASRRERVCQYV